MGGKRGVRTIAEKREGRDSEGHSTYGRGTGRGGMMATL